MNTDVRVIGDHASLFENAFELAVIKTNSRLTYLGYLPALWLGSLRRMKAIEFRKATTVRCEPLNGAKLYAQVDGEPVGRLPVEFSVVPNALTIVVPSA